MDIFCMTLILVQHAPKSYRFFLPVQNISTTKDAFLLGRRPSGSKDIFSHLHGVLSISRQLGKSFPAKIKSEKSAIKASTDQRFNLGASNTSLV